MRKYESWKTNSCTLDHWYKIRSMGFHMVYLTFGTCLHETNNRIGDFGLFYSLLQLGYATRIQVNVVPHNVVFNDREMSVDTDNRRRNAVGICAVESLKW